MLGIASKIEIEVGLVKKMWLGRRRELKRARQLFFLSAKILS